MQGGAIVQAGIAENLLTCFGGAWRDPVRIVITKIKPSEGCGEHSMGKSMEKGIFPPNLTMFYHMAYASVFLAF